MTKMGFFKKRGLRPWVLKEFEGLYEQPQNGPIPIGVDFITCGFSTLGEDPGNVHLPFVTLMVLQRMGTGQASHLLL
jgi:hypothetical protein